MKKILLAGIAVAAFCAPAFAADMPVRAPVYKAGPAPVFSWTGCYIGAHAGYGWGRDKNTFGSLIDGGTPDFAFELGPYNNDPHGGLGGGQLGCNYQAPNNWVVGVEGEYSWSGIRGHHTVLEDALPGGDPGTSTQFSVKNNWNADLAARIGYAMDRNLYYGKVGVAWGHFKYGELHDDFPVATCGGGTSFCTVTVSNTRSGLLLGLGWEYAVQNNWTVKVEYNYINYGSHTLPYPVAANPTFTVRDTENVIKVGVNYLFGK